MLGDWRLVGWWVATEAVYGYTVLIRGGSYAPSMLELQRAELARASPPPIRWWRCHWCGPIASRLGPGCGARAAAVGATRAARAARPVAARAGRPPRSSSWRGWTAGTPVQYTGRHGGTPMLPMGPPARGAGGRVCGAAPWAPACGCWPGLKRTWTVQTRLVGLKGVFERKVGSHTVTGWCSVPRCSRADVR